MLIFLCFTSSVTYFFVIHLSLYLQRSESVVSPSSIYVTAISLPETKNAVQCINKLSFKEIELYGDKRCP